MYCGENFVFGLLGVSNLSNLSDFSSEFSPFNGVAIEEADGGAENGISGSYLGL